MSSQESTSTEVLPLSLDDQPSSPMIELVTTDEVRYSIARSALKLSTVLTTSISDDLTCKEIPIKFESVWFKHVIQFLEYHQDKEAPPEIAKPLRSKVMKEVTTEWCAEYVDKLAKHRDTLWEVMKIANYFDIPSLLHLCCAKTAGLIKGQKLEDIKSILLTNEE